MARFSPPLASFDSGEWSPLLRGRVDAPKYQRSCRLLKNFIPTKQGPARKRPGTKFVNTTKGNAKVRLIPWVFSEDQAYQLEFGANYIRFWTEAGFIETTPGSGTPYEVVTPWTLAQVDELQFAQSADVMYFTHPEVSPRVLSRFADNNWTLTEFAFERGPFLPENADQSEGLRVSGYSGSVTVRAANTTFTADMVGSILALRSVPELLHDQWKTGTVYSIGDRVWSDSLESPGSVNVYKAATAGTSGARAPGHDAGTETDGVVEWEYMHNGTGYIEVTAFTGAVEVEADVVFNPEIPQDWVSWQATGAIEITAQPSDGDTITFNDGSGAVVFEFDNDATTSPGNVAVTIGGDADATFTNFVAAFSSQSFDVGFISAGRELSITHNQYGEEFNLTTLKSGANITVTGMSGGSGVTVSSEEFAFRFSEGSWSDRRGWPRAVTIHDERLWFGYTDTEPTTIWGSNIDDYTNFNAGTALDDEAITKVLGGDALNPVQWLTSNDELVIGTTGSVFVSRTTEGVTLTPTSVQLRSQSQHGASKYQGISVAASVVYVQRSRTTLRELLYNDSINRYTALDLSMTSEHLIEDGIKHIALTNTPDPIIWAYTDAGELVGFTYDRSEDVLGVHHHDLSGIVESVSVIPSADGTQDRLWLVVQRTVNGSTVRHIEYLSKYTDEIHCDAYLTASGTDLTTISLPHLEGETVDVLGDGANQPSKVVASGSITMTRAADEIAAGLPMTAYLTPQQIEGGSTNGTAQGKPSRIHKVVYRLYRTGPGLWHGAEGKTLQEIQFRRAADAMDAPVPLITGDTAAINIDCDYDNGQLLSIEHRGPQPCAIVAIWPQMEVKDML